ncbi:hypothetical protein LUX39_24850 [Actinomadura madurae]|nr:hypothetical protein [Actinomadura madurae]MCQ0016579.1 hypothetical protein [Actinomadura madurae]
MAKVFPSGATTTRDTPVDPAVSAGIGTAGAFSFPVGTSHTRKEPPDSLS